MFPRWTVISGRCRGGWSPQVFLMQIKEAVEERRISRRHLLSVCACVWVFDGYGCVMMSSLSDAVVCAADKYQSQECCIQQMYTDWYWLIGIDWLILTDWLIQILKASDCLQIGCHASTGEQQVKHACHSARGSWKQLIKSVSSHLVSFIIKIWLMINIIKGPPGTEQGLQVVLSNKIACRLSSESHSASQPPALSTDFVMRWRQCGVNT